jgi:demethylmenaquinone methyltransferase/2-methoxy-6-polyprenyl-1,4-benzoquinol methylase
VQRIFWRDDQRRQDRVEADRSQLQGVYFGYNRVQTADKAELVRRHFNAVAQQYDLMNTLLSFGIHHLWKRAAVKMLALTVQDRVLDVCGGTGDLAILAARAVGTAGQVVIYDINRAMIQAGLQKLSHSPLRHRIRHVQGDAEQLSFPDRHFDAAMVGFGIRNVTDMARGFSEMYRVLKPGGRLMCLEFSKPTAPMFRCLYDLYSFYAMPLMGQLVVGNRKAYTHLPESIRMFPLPDELAAMLRRIGFERVTYRRLTNGIAAVHLAQK